ncbi:hypothetical protein FQR65_LT04790 [Abscondita terminalis]|nr:hypothetical protein FQR65_LT04790 [Abscondita terminalis]
MVIKDLITLEFNNALPSWFCFIGHLAITPPIAVYVFHRTKINNILERFEQEPFLPSDEKVDDTIKLLLLKCVSLFLRLTRTDPNDWKMGYGELLDITYSPNFEIVFVYETITVIYSTTIASTITVIIVGVLDYITTQFKILQHNLQMILTTAKESLKQGANVNEISLKFLEEEIKRCVVYHISITNILKEVEDIFTYGIFFIFLSSQSMICIDIYRASILSVQDLRTYRFFVEIMAVSIGLFLINMAGEKMTYECEQIGNATYEINFLGTDTRFQKSLILIMRQSQKSVRIKAGKFIDISLMSFAKIFGIFFSDQSSFWYKTYRYVVLVFFILGFPILAIKDLVTLEFNDALPTWFCVIAYFSVIPVTLTYFFSQQKINKFLKKLEEEPFLPSDEKIDEDVKLLLLKWYRLKNKKAVLFLGAIVTSTTSQTAYSLFLRLTRTDSNDWKLGYGELLNITYSPNFEIVFVYETISLSVQDLRTYRIFVEIMAVSTGLFFINMAGEEMTYEYRQICDAIYEMKFLGQDIRFQKCLIIIMRQCQKPVRVKAGKFINISLMSFAQVVLFIGTVGITIASQTLASLFLRLTKTDSNDWKLGYGDLVNITYSPNFEIVFVYETLSITYSTVITSTIIVMLVGMFDYMTIQIKILRHNLQKLLISAKKSDTNDREISWYILQRKVKTWVVYHVSIMNILKEFENIFSIGILFTVFSIQSMICVDTYRASLFSVQDLRTYKIFVEIMPEVFALILINMAGEKITYECGQICNSIYEINFLGTDIRFQKSLIILMRQCQQPVRIKAGKLIDLSMVSFTQVFGLFLTDQSPLWYKIYVHVVLVLVVLLPVLVIKDLVTLEFNNALPSWFCVIAYFTIIPLVLTYFINRKKINNILERFEQEPFLPSDGRIDDDVKLLLLKWYRLKNKKAVLFLGAIVSSVFSQTIYSLFLRLTRTDPNDWKMGYGELLNITYSPNFEIVFVYESISVIYSTMLVTTVMLIVVGVLDYITTQFKILQYNLQKLLITAEKRLTTDKMESKTFFDVLDKEIKKFVIYHLSITSTFKEVERIFGYAIFFIYFSIQSMICIDIYRASLLSVQDVRTYRILVEIMAVSIDLFLISMAGENVKYESGQICNAIYKIDFVGTDVRFQKSLIILMQQSQTPLQMKAGKFIDVSLMSFAKKLLYFIKMSKSPILQNSFSLENNILKIFGLFLTDQSPLWYKIYAHVVLVLLILFPVLVIKDLVTLEFNNALPSWFCVLGHFTVIPSTLTYFIHRKKIYNILERFEQKPFLPSNGRIDDEAFLFLGAIVSSVFSQTIYSLFLRLTRTDPNDWKMGYGELLNITYSPNFEIVFVYESISITYSTIVVTTLMLLIVGMLDYISTQFKILQHNLQKLSVTTQESLIKNTISWGTLQKEIKNCVIYHLSIKSILKEIEDIFSCAIFFIYFSIQSMICIDIYRASLLSIQDVRTYRIFVEIMAVSIDLFLITMAGENVTYESGQICNAICKIDFVGADIRFQKSLIILMQQSQTPLQMKAGKFIDISLMSFAKLSLQDLRTYRIFFETMAVSIDLFLISLAGENLTHESGRISNAIYEIDFLGTDIRFQKSLIILIRQSQQPARIKAGKFIEISLMSFTKILLHFFKMSKSTILHNSFSLENNTLKIFGVYTTDKSPLWYKMYSYVVLALFIILFPFLVIKDLVTMDFNDALPSWFCVVAHFTIIPTTVTYFVYRKKIYNVMERFEQEPFLPSDERVDEVVKLILLKWYRLKNRKAVLFLGAMFTSVTSQTLYTLFLRLTRTDPNEWKMGYGELLNITYSPNFEIVYVYESFSVIHSTMITSTVWALIFGMLDYITTQFKILQHHLRTLIITAKKSLAENTIESEISWEVLRKEIRKCVLYHISITNILTEFEDIFSYGIFFIFLSIQSMICIDIYRASLLSFQDLRTYRIFVETIAVSIGLFLINLTGENMTYECGQICNAIYEINFLGSDIRFQKSLIILMRQCQKPVRIKAGKFIEISLMSFAKVVYVFYHNRVYTPV